MNALEARGAHDEARSRRVLALVQRGPQVPLGRLQAIGCDCCGPVTHIPSRQQLRVIGLRSNRIRNVEDHRIVEFLRAQSVPGARVVDRGLLRSRCYTQQ